MDNNITKSTVKIDYVKPGILHLDSLQTVHGGEGPCKSGSVAEANCEGNGGQAGGSCIYYGNDAQG